LFEFVILFGVVIVMILLTSDILFQFFFVSFRI
jgi:hypothetical protein